MAAVKEIVFHGQHVHGLHVAVPGVFMRVHDVKTLPGCPPGRRRKPQLIDPSRLEQGRGNAVVENAGPPVINLLRKHMDFVLCGQMLDKLDRIALGPAACGRKRAVKNCDA